jgi:demethylspheroidene O-methyltransferase
MRAAWLPDALRSWQARLIARPAFRSRVQKTPLIQYFARRHAVQLFALASGFVHSQVLVAILRTGLLAEVASGPATAAKLSADTGIPASRLALLLRAAVALGLMHEQRDGRFELGTLGAALVDNEALVALILHHDALYEDLADPSALVGNPEFSGQLRRFWRYAARGPSTHDDVLAYSRLMAASQDAVASEVLTRCNPGNACRWLDVGGGDGSFAIALARHYPKISITVTDLPPVAELARRKIAAAGLANRIDVVPGDFLSDALPGGQDIISLIRILHDHDDAPVQRLLLSVKQALAANGRVVIAEPMASGSHEGRLLEAYFDMYLMAMGQGRLRRYSELQSALTGTGFGRVRRLRTRMPLISGLVEGYVLSRT